MTIIEVILVYLCCGALTYLLGIMALIFDDERPRFYEMPSFFVVMVLWPFILCTIAGSYINERIFHLILVIRERRRGNKD
jgi:uncharacterized membrane protein